MEKKEIEISFKDRISTVDKKGKRIWLYPKKAKGKLTNYRKIVGYFLLVFLIGTPFIKVDGEQFLLFNFLERKFVIFGQPFWPQDFHLFVFMTLAVIVFIILFTVVFGRLFCGWICPQTIFMEFVFRQIEFWIEGDYTKQKRLSKQKWNTEKIIKKTSKHIIFYLISFVTFNTFLSYIISMDVLLEYIVEGPTKHKLIFLSLVVLSSIHYFVFSWFREQVCTIVCPYGRLQGVMLDSNSVVVAYDYKRGEPRGKLSKKINDLGNNQGDCIDCKVCVQVCPTGIDIRNGTQLECVNCTACIDACDEIMDKVKKPRGLIRYDSENGIKKGVKKIFNNRSIAYSLVLSSLIVFVIFLFSLRTSVEVTILRAQLRNSLFQINEKGEISNLYKVSFVNKTKQDLNIEFKLLSHQGKIRSVGRNLSLSKYEKTNGMIFIDINKDLIKQQNTKLLVAVFSNGKKIDEVETTFLGPINEN